MVYTEQEYLRRSERERIMLNILFSKIYNKDEHQDNIHHSPADSKEPYDSIVCRFKNGLYENSHIWEVKVRDANYNEILFEKNKYNSLKKIAERYEGDTRIFYVSTHPNGTYIFNITKIEQYGLLKWIKQEHNRSTVEKWRGKVEKELIYLPASLAKFVDIKVSDIDRVEKEIEESKKPKKKVVGFDLENLH